MCTIMTSLRLCLFSLILSCVLETSQGWLVPNWKSTRATKRENPNSNHIEKLQGARDLMKRIVDARVSFKECNMEDGLRQDCGFFGIDEDTCYKRGCCWGESRTNGVPWCYHSKPTLKPQCTMQKTERIECGFYGIRKEQCLAQSCCWQPAEGAPWCFNERRVPVFEGECGVPPVPPTVPVGRIVGGTETKEHSWPWMVSVRSGDHFCGGSLINSRWVLSAAHCEPGFHRGGGTNTIIAGMHHQANPAGGQREVEIEKIIPHPGYDDNAYDNDMMLLKLAENIEFGETIQPVCLPGQNQRVDVGSHCYSTGWGDTAFMGSSPDALQQVMLPILSEQTCNQDGWYDGRITDNMICAGYHEGGRDSCQGDSGGPLVCYEDGHWLQFGVVSWGDGCAGEEKPGLYARVSNYAKWIEETVRDN